MHSIQNTSFHFQNCNWQGIWHVPDAEVQKVVVAFHGQQTHGEMGNYLPLYTPNTAMLSVGIAHQNGNTVPPHLQGLPSLSPSRWNRPSPPGFANWRLGIASSICSSYSLGGRLALTLFERNPTLWSGLVLLAPDGFKKNAMYRFAVDTSVGRSAWKWVDRHAEAVRSLVRFLRRIRLIPAHLEHFALHHTQDHNMRQLVANTWKTHRLFWPSLNGSAKAWSALPARNVRMYAIFGTRDAIIPWTWSAPWRGLGNSHVHFLRMESGHVMRHPDTVADIRRLILAATNENQVPMNWLDQLDADAQLSANGSRCWWTPKTLLRERLAPTRGPHPGKRRDRCLCGRQLGDRRQHQEGGPRVEALRSQPVLLFPGAPNQVVPG